MGSIAAAEELGVHRLDPPVWVLNPAENAGFVLGEVEKLDPSFDLNPEGG
jgi:hypothetical protein